MKKFYILFLVIVFTVALNASQASLEKLTPMLKDMVLRAQYDTSKFDVLIRVKGDVNLRGIRGNHRAVVKTLKDSARIFQAGITKYLRDSDCDEFEPFYIVNLVHAVISKKTLLDMIKREDVVKVYYNDKAKLFPVYKGTPMKSDGEYEWNLTLTNVDKVRKAFGLTGKGVVLGHIDTGADGNHPDLKGKIIKWKDFVNGKEEPYDDQGHGTHTAGTIAGGSASGKAIGAAPDAKLIVAKVFTSSGSANTSDILKAMEWMLDPDGNPDTNDAPRLVSNSWGSSSQTKDVYWEAVQKWIDANIFPCFAAGNSGPSAHTVGTPGGFPHAFAVGATDKYDKIAYFSSRGPITWGGKEYIKPDVSSPGKDITSAWPGGGYNTISGTSMATPLVAGIIGLLYQANPDLTIEEVKKILESSGKDLGDPGKDNTYGSCRVDAYNAVVLVLDSGKFSGKVVDAKSGQGIRAKFVDSEKGIDFETAKDGTFRATLQSGKYNFKVTAFGYLEKSVSIVVKKDEVTKKDISLDPAPRYKLYGKVSNKAGEPLKAVVEVSPLSPVICAEDGTYQLELPEGTYEAKVSCKGYETQVRTGITIKEDREENFILEKLPPILLVDQDNGKEVEKVFMGALDAAKMKYSYFKADTDKVTAELLNQYPVVIWFTGKAYRHILGAEERKALKEYLSKGGNLFLTGQDIGYAIKSSEFFSDYLKATYGGDNAQDHTVKGLPGTIAQGLELDITGANANYNQDYPDYFQKTEGKVILKYGNDRLAGYVYDSGVYKLVYLGFGLEGIKSKLEREKLMKKVVKYLLPTLKEDLEKVEKFYAENRDLLPLQNRILAKILKEVKAANFKGVKTLIEKVQMSNRVPYAYILKKLNEYALNVKDYKLIRMLSVLK